MKFPCTIIGMGVNQSTCKGTSGDQGVYSSTPRASSCLMEMLKPECLKMEEKNKRKRAISLESTKKSICNNDYANSKGGGSSRSGTRTTTLEECLLASPGHCNISGGELYVLKQNSRRIHPAATTSSSSKQPSRPDHGTSPLAEKARDSFSLQRLVAKNDGIKNGDEAKLSDSFSNISCRNQSGIHNKVKKKVSFRFPEEADIFVFYPSEEIMTTEIDDMEEEDEVQFDASTSGQDLESKSTKTPILVS